MVDKAALGSLGHKLVCRSVKRWDEELRQLVKDRSACFDQGLDEDSNWNRYLKLYKEVKQKINSNYKKNYKGILEICECLRYSDKSIGLCHELIVMAIVLRAMQVSSKFSRHIVKNSI